MTFQDRLESSVHAVSKVATALDSMGLPVHMLPVRKGAPDDGDIQFSHLTGETVYDVKHRSIDFTGPADFPYPSIIVCQSAPYGPKSKWNDFVIVAVNKDCTCAAFVNSKTSDRWVEQGGHLVCPVEYATFVTL